MPPTRPLRSELARERLGVLGASGTLLGVLLSGPLAVALVTATHPQPPWRSAEHFANSYHPVQDVPYLGGIVLVFALVVLITSVGAMAHKDHEVRMQLALAFTTVFATLVFFNYVVQTTYVPGLVLHYDDGNAPLIAAFSMANPTSLAWGIEMWGWGFLGVATWLAAAAFGDTRIERGAALAFVANGLISLFGVLWTVTSPGWVVTSAGLVAFAAWNVLLALMAALTLCVFLKRGRKPTSPERRFSRPRLPSLRRVCTR